MIAVVAVLAALQGSGPVVTAHTDRTRLAVGETVVLTILVRTRSVLPVAFAPVPFPGFAVVATHEVSDVSVSDPSGAAPLRATVRGITLRAERSGALVIGPIRVQQGGKVAVAKAIAVVVDRAAGPGVALSAPARSLLAAAPSPPGSDQVFLTVLVPRDTVFVGQQLDVVVAAWFPRDLRLRLRGQPRVTVPVPARVWSYPEERPEESVASREVRGKWMDAYAVHCVMFPLEPGRLVIPPAAVEYGVPVSFSIFSREERYTLRSDSVGVAVVAAPPGGRPADDQQVAGEGVTLTISVTPPNTRVGEPLTVLATVSGVGNAALWPAPVLRWPAGLRVYPAETEVTIEPQNGRVAGTKAVSYLVVPESSGTVILPEMRYPYYDLAAGGYAVARTPPRTIVVLPGLEPQVARALPPLLPGDAVAGPGAWVRDSGPAGLLALIGVPPLIALFVSRRRRRERIAAGAPRAVVLTRLGRLERDFLGLLASYVLDPGARDGDGLARALRGAGIDSPVADHVMRLRDRLRATRYGPHGQGDAAELAAELEQVLRVLGADPSGPRRRRVAMSALCAVALVGSPSSAQSPSAETLYDAGALRAAADSFAGRAIAQPDAAANWYNLGATLYRAGADGKAVAAWTIAARLEPRNRVILRARALLPPPDLATESLLTVGPATPMEWAVGAALAWLLLWAAIVARRRRGVVIGLAVATVVMAAFGAAERMRRVRPLAVVLNGGTAVRAAPYGRATPSGTLDAGSALLVDGTYGRWVKVRRADGIHGWVLGSDVVRL